MPPALQRRREIAARLCPSTASASLMITDDNQSLFATKITVVVNWAAELNRVMAEHSAIRK